MKCFLAIALLVVLVQAVLGDNDYCTSDYHCDYDECCKSNICRDKSDDIGEPCGGRYHCDTCDDGLACVTHPNSGLNAFRWGTGSCQYPRGR